MSKNLVKAIVYALLLLGYDALYMNDVSAAHKYTKKTKADEDMAVQLQMQQEQIRQQQLEIEYLRQEQAQQEEIRQLQIQQANEAAAEERIADELRRARQIKALQDMSRMIR